MNFEISRSVSSSKSIPSSSFGFKTMKKFRPLSFIRRRFYTLIILVLFTVCFVHYSGLFLYLTQCELNENYVHPVNQPNLTSYVDFYNENFRDYDSLESLKVKANQKFDYKTLDNNFNERFLIENRLKCQDNLDKYQDIRLLILVKSALPNRQQRDLIRKSWANEQRFSDVKIRTLFSVGSCDSVINDQLAKLDVKKSGRNCQDLIDEENEQNTDLIQIDFVDSYYNNTIKTLNGIKWIVKNCPKAQFVVLIDDDYYLSVKNLLQHIRWLNYDNESKKKILQQMSYMKTDYEKSLINEMKSKFDPFTENLYTGWVFNSSVPCRYRFSKWFVNLDEYPFATWPPYVTAGFVLLSNKSLKSIYFASLYTKSFRFDDIYLSILTRKIGINPLHNADVYFNKRYYSESDDYLALENVIASHGFHDGHEMIKIWLAMKRKGFA